MYNFKHIDDDAVQFQILRWLTRSCCGKGTHEAWVRILKYWSMSHQLDNSSKDLKTVCAAAAAACGEEPGRTWPHPLYRTLSDNTIITLRKPVYFIACWITSWPIRDAIGKTMASFDWLWQSKHKLVAIYFVARWLRSFLTNRNQARDPVVGSDWLK